MKKVFTSRMAYEWRIVSCTCFLYVHAWRCCKKFPFNKVKGRELFLKGSIVYLFKNKNISLLLIVIYFYTKTFLLDSSLSEFSPFLIKMLNMISKLCIRIDCISVSYHFEDDALNLFINFNINLQWKIYYLFINFRLCFGCCFFVVVVVGSIGHTQHLSNSKR